MDDPTRPALLTAVRNAARRRARAEPPLPAERDWRTTEALLEREVLGRPRAATKLVDAFARLARADGSREALGRAARLAGARHAHAGRYEKAIPHYEEAARLLGGAARDGARLGMAGALLRLGRFDEARTSCASVRRAARRRGDTLLAAAADLNEGVALHESGHARRAVAPYRRALEGLTAAGHAHLAATAAQNLANALVLLDRLAEAGPLYERASRGFASLGLAHESARCDLNRGALLVASDRLGDAEPLLADAEERLREGGDAAQAALCRLDRGDLLLRAGLFAEALETLQSARRQLRRGAPPGERRRAVLAISRAQLALGDGSAALRTLRGVSAETPAERANVTELRAAAHLLRGRHGAAQRGYSVAARLFGGSRPLSRLRALIGAAHCALEQDNVARARRVRDRAAKTRPPATPARVDFALAALDFRIEARRGRADAADRALEAALSALERVRTGLGGDAQRAALLTGREAFLSQAVRHLVGRPGGDRRALEVVERFRGRALAELAGDAASWAGDGADLDELRARIARLEASLGRDELPSLLRGRETSPETTVARQLGAAERDYARAVARVRPAVSLGPPPVERARESLPPGTLVVSVYSDAEGTCLFALGEDGLHLVRTSTTGADVDRLMRTLHFRLGRFSAGPEFVARHARRLARDTDRVLDELAAHFVAPLRDQLDRCRRLVVIPGGPWHGVPFAALPTGDGRLVESVPVALAPSLGALQERVPAARGSSVVCGFADEGAPSIDVEVRRIAERIGRVRVLRGDDATTPSIRNVVRPACLHVAAHGLHRPDAPAMSGVRLADGWLRAADLFRMDLRGALLVLSGCETGVSTIGAGDEMHGLVRGAFAAGARAVVGTLWRVDDEASAELMVAFHAARRGGRSTEAALAEAQRTQIAKGRHPWYWSGFGAWTRAFR